MKIIRLLLKIWNFKGFALKKKILLMTSQYPYGHGETFVEEEMEFVTNNCNFDITVSPMQTPKGMVTRKLPNNVDMKPVVIERSWFKRFFSLLSPRAVMLVISELATVISLGKVHLKLYPTY